MSEVEILRLTRLAYNAAANVEGWPPFLEAYARALDGGVATLLSWDRQNKGSSLRITAGPHASNELVHEYNAYYAARNPWLLNATPYMRAGAITLSHVIHPVSELRKSEFYNDFLARYDLSCGVGACLLENDGVFAHLSLNRRLRAELCDVREVRFVRQLFPHLQRAIRIHTLLERLRIDYRTDADALDQVSAGVLLVSADARVRFANRAATRLLAEGDGLAAGRDGLRAATAAQTRALRGLIAQAARGAQGETLDGGGGMRLSRPSRKSPLSVLVAPTVPAVGYPRLSADCVTLVVRDPADTVEGRVVLMALYGLTSTEARFAELQLSGNTLETSADILAIARETARTHLKSILRKSGTNRQADFVRAATLSLAGHLQLQTAAHFNTVSTNRVGRSR